MMLCYHKIITQLNLAEHPLILANSTYALLAKYQVIFCAILRDNFK